MKFIKLTRILDTPTEEAENRYIEFQKKIYLDSEGLMEEPTDEDGRTAKWYKNLNIPVPKELQKPNESKEYTFEFKREDYDRNYSEFLCNLSRIEGFDALEDGTTLVCYPNDFEIIVKENIEEIEKLINKL